MTDDKQNPERVTNNPGGDRNEGEQQRPPSQPDRDEHHHGEYRDENRKADKVIKLMREDPWPPPPEKDKD